MQKWTCKVMDRVQWIFYLMEPYKGGISVKILQMKNKLSEYI